MPDGQWMLKGREFANCNCAYGCPCQFNALPTYGHCHGLAVLEIEEGYHGDTRLDGLRGGGIYCFPGPIHEGKGEGVLIIDTRASPQQRKALLRIFSGEDTAPAATIWAVFAAMVEKMHEPVFADIDFTIDIAGRRARAAVAGLAEMRGEPILNPVTGLEHRVRIEQPNGFEFTVAEIGRGWSKTRGPVAIELADSYGQFANIHLCQSGVVR